MVNIVKEGEGPVILNLTGLCGTLFINSLLEVPVGEENTAHFIDD